MNRKILAGLAFSTLMIMGCNEKGVSEETSQPLELKTLEQRLSYVIGLDLGTKFKQDDIRIDVVALSQAIKDTQAGSEKQLSDEEVRLTLQAFQDKRQAAETEERGVVAEANIKEGETFLAENAQKESVVSLPSGLQYKIITEGAGPKPTVNDTVSVHYRGTLIDGTEFDSSYSRGEPVSFPVTGVIAGWTEALQLMNEGAKWELYVPSPLAYGPGGTGGPIGPNATLIFEVELLKAQAN